jgi:hypothetical protein
MLKIFAILTLIMIPNSALATEVMNAAPTMDAAPIAPVAASSSDLVDLIFKILVGLASLIFTLLFYFKKMQWAKHERTKQITGFADLAFNAVEGLVKKSENKIDDKLLEFLRRINAMIKEAGMKELSENETKQLKEYAANKALAKK